MKIEKNKSKLKAVFVLGFFSLNVFFLFLYLNLQKANKDHQLENRSIHLLNTLKQVRSSVYAYDDQLHHWLLSTDTTNIAAFQTSYSTLLNDTLLLYQLRGEFLDSADLRKMIDLIRKKTDLFSEINPVIRDVRFINPALFKKASENDRFSRTLNNCISEVEQLEHNSVRDSNLRRMSINDKAGIGFHVIAAVFNGILILFYFLLIRNFKLQEEKGVWLSRQVADKANELDAVYEHISDAFISFDNDWNYIHVNSKAAEFHERPVTDLIGKNIWKDFPELVKEPFYAALIEAKKSMKTVRVELFYEQKGIWFEDLIYPTDEGLSVYYHEITARKKAELALKKSEAELKISNERYDLVAKATNDVLWDWNITKNEILGNEALIQILGIQETKPVSYSIFQSRIHQEDVGVFTTELKKAFQEMSGFVHVEFRFRLADGVIASMYNRGYVLYDQNRQPIRMVSAMQDITNQKRARQQLLLEKELSDSIINSLPGIFYLFNKQGKLYRWNNNLEKLLGYSRDELLQLEMIDLIKEEDRQTVREKFTGVFQKGSDQVEAVLITRSRQEIPFFFNGMCIHYEGENCLLGIGLDLSEKVKAHNELRELSRHLQHASEKERAYIAREIHDELGQQMTGLKMDVSWLSKKINPTDPEIQQRLHDITSLIDETVKSIRRISSQLRPGILDDLGLVAALEWQGEEFAKRSGIQVDFHSNMEWMELPQDIATGLFRIYQESLTNVSRHAAATRVDASLLFDGTRLHLKIQDNGKGFSREALSEKKTLGLLGMKERTLLMGGTYSINTQQGDGTTVEVIVPIPAKEEK